MYNIILRHKDGKYQFGVTNDPRQHIVLPVVPEITFREPTEEERLEPIRSRYFQLIVPAVFDDTKIYIYEEVEG